MKFWIARDEDDELYLFDERPELFTSCIWGIYTDSGCSFKIDNNLFPEVTFENSPQEVEFKFIKK